MTDAVREKFRPLIAILDDEEVFRTLLAYELQERGFLAVSSENKQEFFDSLGEINPDVIISDVMSPVLNGLAFLKKIKASERFRSIPVIFTTGYATAREELYLQGAFAVMAKPYKFEDLINCLDRALETLPTS